jgi:hypothetical protein
MSLTEEPNILAEFFWVNKPLEKQPNFLTKINLNGNNNTRTYLMKEDINERMWYLVAECVVL